MEGKAGRQRRTMGNRNKGEELMGEKGVLKDHWGFRRIIVAR